MTEVLSQDEIDRILSSLDDYEDDLEYFRLVKEGRKIKIYDFKRPDKFTKGQIRAMSILHETFSRELTITLSSLLGIMIHTHVASVDQLTFEEFTRCIPTPSCLSVIQIVPLEGNAVMEIEPEITFAIIDRICGGTGDGVKYQHELADLEQSVMEVVINNILLNLKTAWSDILMLPFVIGLNKLETNPQFLRVTHPNEMVIMVTHEFKVGGTEGMVNICYPYQLLETVVDKLDVFKWYGSSIIAEKEELINRDRIPVTLTAELIRFETTLEEVNSLEKGSIICRLQNNKYSRLSLGGMLVWQCEDLGFKSAIPRHIKIKSLVVDPYKLEVNRMEVEKINKEVMGALAKAPITITVELGSVYKSVKEILCMGEGTIVELDKLAGEPVDIKANGTLIGRGEVVVIDENFGVRVTEISERSSLLKDFS